MKTRIASLLQEALESLAHDGVIAADSANPPQVERTRDSAHGHFSTNIALVLAKACAMRPRALAEQIVGQLPRSEVLERVEIAGPGFINFFLTSGALRVALSDALDLGERYGRSAIGAGKTVQVEYVSANPTGPLHVGHGRGAAYGATVAELFSVAGFTVHREYYINDAGRQMDILAVSVWLRYLEQCEEHVTFPSNGYRGAYVREIAESLRRAHGNALSRSPAQVMDGIPADEPQGGDKEAHIDALIERARSLLGSEHYRVVFDCALESILEDIREDLREFGVLYDEWFSERSLNDSGAVNRVIERLRKSGHLYQQDGAWWFRSSAFGDEKDRVVIRENGQQTYFAADIAYHANKIERGFDRVIDVWGADHHGYVPRIKAALTALGDDASRLDVLLVQFAILYRNGEKVPMSTRAGEFVTLRELRDEVGRDAARFFYVLRKCEQHMDFDLDLAKSQSADNPVYYVQYAHARVCSVMRQLEQKGLQFDEAQGRANVEKLTEAHEEALINAITQFPEVVENAALSCAPHLLAHYLRELANAFHTYYNAHQFLVDDVALRNARLLLILAARQVIANGLRWLGVNAPESM